jgi:protein subunit release factor B
MKKELLFSITKKDFEIQTFPAGGPGGQKQNKTASAVRIIHKESGAVGESRTDRSQSINKKLALERLVANNKFKVWINKKVFELKNKKTIDQMVDEQLKSENLKVEVKDDEGKWTILLKENVDE